MVVIVTVVVGVGMVVAMTVIANERRLSGLHVLGERRTHRGTALVVVIRELVVPRRERPLLRLGLGLRYMALSCEVPYVVAAVMMR